MQLTQSGQAAKLARWGFNKWFTALEVTIELGITQVHARINDIRASGGTVLSEDITLNEVKLCRYRVSVMPDIKGDPNSFRASVPTSVATAQSYAQASGR
jgi:hypothetical protein